MFGRFFVPGPVEVHPDVLAAMTRPMLHHRGKEAKDLYARVGGVLREVFGTARPVRFLASSGTGAVEAGIRALPAGRVLALVNGAFAERMARIAETCHHEVDRIEAPLGRIVAPETVAGKVRTGNYVGVLAVHNETSTGALQPLSPLARAAGDVPLVVDSVSGAAGAPIDLDACGIAYACTGSQKALALPPGLGFAAASEGFLARARQSTERGFYLDLLAYDRDTPPYTPALPLLYALDVQAARIAAEGLPARFARHRAMAGMVCAWALRRGLGITAAEGLRSPTVTCLELPPPLTGLEFVERMRGRGYVVGGGYGPLKERCFRIGHMGDQTEATVEALLRACDDALAG
ncbi:MAG TPA: aminotransferase class V-fold PLP-dependent enzyme [Planctomycetota bacterium]|nr:aminotransferase class V-fold PLP-dependent enzyme [Planctomycetota bacterium]